MGSSHSVHLPENQAVVRPNETPGETGYYRSIFANSKKTSDGLIDSLFDGKVNSVFEAFEHGVTKAGNNDCLGERRMEGDVAKEFVFQTYNEVQNRVRKFGSGLIKLGAVKGDRIGLFSQNNSCWTMTDLACSTYSFISVPLYDTLGTSAVNFIAQQAEIKYVVCSQNKMKILSEVINDSPSIKYIIQMEDVTDADKSAYLSKGVHLFSFSEVEKYGAEGLVDPIPPKPEDIFTLCYTSGTTGNPKGAILTHRNVVADSGAILHHLNGGEAFVRGVTFDIGDYHISYLPASHVFERLIQIVILSCGAAIGFSQGDVLKLFDDINALRPTFFPSVPRLLNRLYDKVTGAINQAGGVKKSLFDQGYAAKKDRLKYGIVTHSIWDGLLFNKIKAKLGGRVRMIITGSAPIGADVLEFLRICFCCNVFEGYGQTEASAASTVTLTGDCSVGHVGPPVPSVEIKLVDVPEMNYHATDKPNPRGEICVKGYSVFPGYYKDEQNTAEAIDAQGWLHSGDIGTFLPNGCLKVIDRKKNIFKLSQGEYVAPEKLENVYVKHNLVAQIFVHGDSLQSTLVAIVVPDPETVIPYAKANGIEGGVEGVCKNAEFQKKLLSELNTLGKAGGLKGFELIKALRLEASPFTVENDLLTPTFKLKRPKAKQYYITQIDEMYAEINSAPSSS